MAQSLGKRQPPPLPVVALILLMCIVTGLIAGAGTRQLVTNLASSGPGAPSAVGTGLPANHETVTSTPDLSPPAASTPTLSQGGPTGFTLQVKVSPPSVSAGHQFTVTATVLASDGVTLLAGVACTISAAGGPNLFTDWPAAVVSNAQGIAAWTLQAPSIAPGTYQMRVEGAGSRGYLYWVYASIVISAA